MSTRTTSTTPATRRERRAQDRRSNRTAPAVRPRRSPLSPFIVVTIAAVVVMVAAIGAIALTSNPGGTPSVALTQPPDTGIPAQADGEALGRADAPVVLEVYADYQCPWCGKFSRETLPNLVRTFVVAGQLRIEEHTIAFLGTTTPDESLDAATAAACAAPAGKFWEFHEYLTWNQQGENQGGFSRARLGAIADAIGLDRAAFTSCLDDPVVRGTIVDRTDGAFAAGINSTPTFVLDGEKVSVGSFGDLVPLIQAKVDATAGS